MTLTINVNENSFHSKILEITNEKLYISFPINDKTGKTAYFIDITELFVSFISQDQNVYNFSTTILGRKKLNEVPVILIKKPSKNELVKIQRREYFRVDINLDVILEPENNQPPLITTTRDISGGGLAVYGMGKEKLYQPGDLMNVLLVLPFNLNDYFYLKAQVEVIRTLYDQDNHRGIITYKFKEIDQFSRDKIIKFCFEKQLENRRKFLNA